MDLQINQDFYDIMDSDKTDKNMKPYFKYYYDCDNITDIETQRHDPLEIIKLACEIFQKCVTGATINKFEHYQRWQYNEKGGRTKTSYETPDVNNINDCQEKCIKSNKNCMMFKFTEQKRCYLYNFTNTHPTYGKFFKKVSHNAKVDTFLRTDVYDKIDYISARRLNNKVVKVANATNSTSNEKRGFYDFNEVTSNSRRKEIGNILCLSFLFILFKIFN
jgi:hypothetical protein